MARAGKSVLVIEDDQAIRSLLVDVLVDDGYEVRDASDGEEALAVLEGWQPDLIILDQLMPRMDGTAFRAEQLSRPHLAAIPTLLLSAIRDLPEQARDLEVEATMPKPFNLDELLVLAAQLIADADEGTTTHADATYSTEAKRNRAGDSVAF
jgi:CheY-like chemotaxis protein